MFERILIAVDGSNHSRRAATVGLKLATTYAVDVDVLHALENMSLTDNANEQDQGQHSKADEVLDEFIENTLRANFG